MRSSCDENPFVYTPQETAFIDASWLLGKYCVNHCIPPRVQLLNNCLLIPRDDKIANPYPGV